MSALTAPPVTAPAPIGHKTLKGLIVSDLHRGAPYSDPIRVDDAMHQALVDPETAFCVWNGDINEGVNLSVKHLPETEEEARRNSVALGEMTEMHRRQEEREIRGLALERRAMLAQHRQNEKHLAREVMEREDKSRNAFGRHRNEEEKTECRPKPLTTADKELRDMMAGHLQEEEALRKVRIQRKALDRIREEHRAEEEAVVPLYEEKLRGMFVKHREEERALRKKTRTQNEARDEMLTKHCQYIEQQVRNYPHCKFYYVIGNHERLPEFIDAFMRLAEKLNRDLGKERLVVTENHVRIGDGLIIHGDQQMNPEKYHVGKAGMFDESDAEMHRRLWLQVIHDHGNKFLPRIVGELLHYAELCAQNILHWFHENDPKTLEGVKHIFFGHTHFPINGARIIDGIGRDFTRRIFEVGEDIPAGKKRKAYINEAADLKTHREYGLYNTGANITRWGNEDIFNPLRVVLKAVPGRNVDLDDASSCAIESVERIMQPQKAAVHAGISR